VQGAYAELFRVREVDGEVAVVAGEAADRPEGEPAAATAT
jgi:hypothetical protein